MPDFAEIEGALFCPHCRSQFDNQMDIWWGKLPYTYKVGDRIKWKRHRNGKLVDPYMLDEGQDTWNCGDPEILDLLVFDSNFYSPEEERQCSKCGKRLGAAMARVVDGVIRSTEMLSWEETKGLLGESIGKADIIEVREDGSRVVREDLFDHPTTLRFRKK